MIKVCHVTTVHPTNDVRIFQKECVSLAKNPDYNVILIGSGGSRQDKSVTIKGIESISKNRFQRVSTHTRKIVKMALMEKADIYHLHDPELLLYTKAFKRSGALVVFDSHEDYANQILTREYLPIKLRKSLSAIYKRIEDISCRYIDGAIVPCPINNKHLFENRVKHCEYINNLPILENNLPEEPVNNGREVVCYTGSLSHARGIDFLVRACSLAGVSLILAGRFESKEYQEYIESMPEYRVVDYRGYCSKDQITDIYKESSVGANVLLNVGQYKTAQNLSTKVYEYMMMGIPFVINDTPYNQEFLKKHPCGICVDPMDITDIAKGIKTILKDRNRYAEMSRCGISAVSDELNWNNEEKKLYKFYDCLLRESKPGIANE